MRTRTRTRPPMPTHNGNRGTLHARRCGRRLTTHGRDAAYSGSNNANSTNGATAPSCRPPGRHPAGRWRGWHRRNADRRKRLTRYACTPFLSAAKEREERMPPLNPPASRHAGAPDAKIHKLAYGFKQYEFWPRPTLACRAADKAGTRYPADCNVRAGVSQRRCKQRRHAGRRAGTLGGECGDEHQRGD